MNYTSEKLRKIKCIYSVKRLGFITNPISSLCADLIMSMQTVNSALRNLEKEGILFLEVYSGRNKRAVLTEKGNNYVMIPSLLIAVIAGCLLVKTKMNINC